MSVAVTPPFLIDLGIAFAVEDLRQGVQRDWLDEAGAVAIALNELTLGTDDPKLVEIGCLLSDELGRVREILFDEESALLFADETDVPSRTWRFVLLKAAFEQRAILADPLGLVEEIYADFGYPTEMESFVRYMPLRLGDTPGESALTKRWKRFLALEEVELARNAD